MEALAGEPDLVVLGLPRGGVPVAFEVARAIGAPLDVLTVRKLGVPGHEELAMGAIASGGVRVLNRDVIAGERICATGLEEVTAREQRELARRELAYRGSRPALSVRGQHALVVDDGLATGASMRVAIAALRRAGARTITVAVPVAAGPTCAMLENDADRVVCARRPEPFFSVGAWYRDFSPVSDEQVRELLQGAWRGEAGGTRPG